MAGCVSDGATDGRAIGDKTRNLIGLGDTRFSGCQLAGPRSHPWLPLSAHHQCLAQLYWSIRSQLTFGDRRVELESESRVMIGAAKRPLQWLLETNSVLFVVHNEANSDIKRNDVCERFWHITGRSGDESPMRRRNALGNWVDVDIGRCDQFPFSSF